MRSKRKYFSTATKNNLFLVEHNGQKAVLRRRKEQFVNNTLKDEGEYMGFDYRVRSMPETAIFAQKLLDNGIPVPKIFEYKDNYLIEEFINGTPLDEVFGQTEDYRIIERFLKQVTNAHQKGLVIAERWGKNEILTKTGDIIFIDLDIEYICDFAKELELTEAVNAVACFSKRNSVSLWLGEFLKRESIKKNYDVNKIIWLLKKHIEFWGDEGKYLRLLINTAEGKL